MVEAWDLFGIDYYGSNYFEADQKILAAQRLRRKIQKEVRDELARQEDRYINKMIDELQIALNKIPFTI